MTDLQITDFKRIELDNLYYLSHNYIGADNERYELCIELCLNGFDVANYKLTGSWHELTDDKYCVNVDMRPGNGLDFLEAISRAIAMASFFKQKYATQTHENTKKDDLPVSGPRPIKVRA